MASDASKYEGDWAGFEPIVGNEALAQEASCARMLRPWNGGGYDVDVRQNS